MIKIIQPLLLLLMLVLPGMAMAQDDYCPFVEEGKEWRSVEGSAQEYYWFEGDTTLQGRLCKKLYFSTKHNATATSANSLYMGAFYEDGRRVYFFYPHDSVPRLYMAFNVQAGDELEVWTPSSVGRQIKCTIEVTRIDTVTRRGRSLRCVSFLNKTESDTGMNHLGSNMNFWMQGIGAPTDPERHVYGNGRKDSGATTYFVTDLCHVGTDTLYTLANLPAPLLDEEAYRDHQRPFIEEGKRWLTTTYATKTPLKVSLDTYDYGTFTSINTYFFGGDTIVGGSVCMKMMRESIRNATDVTTEYVGAFREDGRRVWCYAPGSTEAHLLYDFQAVYGDTVSVWQQSSDADTCLILQSHKSVWSGGVPMKSVSLGNTYYLRGQHFQPSWVEGVGSMAAPLLNVSPYHEGEWEELRCCWVGADTLYNNMSDINYVREQVCDGLHVMHKEPDEPYIPFVEAGKCWATAHFRTYASQHADDIETLSTYILDGDTTIAATRCLKLMRINVNIAADTSDTVYVASLFEDDRRVMFFPPGLSRAYLMHDFYATSGDTLLCYDCESQDWQSPRAERLARPVYAVVVGHTDEMLGDRRQKVCWLAPESVYANYDCWMKGIGDRHSPTHAAGVISDNRATLLRCTVGNRVLYQLPKYDDFIDVIKDIMPSAHSGSTQIVNSKSVNRKCFDLSGRRIAAPPARGLYIEDGKVKGK